MEVLQEPPPEVVVPSTRVPTAQEVSRSTSNPGRRVEPEAEGGDVRAMVTSAAQANPVASATRCAAAVAEPGCCPG